MERMKIDRRGLMAAGAAGALAPSPLAGAGTPGARSEAAPLFNHAPPPGNEAVAQIHVEIPGARLYVRDSGGGGTPIVLLHPASGSALIWAYQETAFIDAGYRVIAYSRRGYAGSSPFDMADPGSGSRDLYELARAMNLPRFHLVASAAGGSIATDFALSYPDRLLSLTISSNSAGVREGAIFDAAERIRPAGWDKMPVEFRELGPSYRAANAEGVRLWLDLEHRALVGTEYRQIPTQRITGASLRSIRTPVLLIAGAADLITPPAITRLLRDAIPHSEMIVADETGHSVYWERPDLFNAATLAFVARHRG